MAELRTVEIQHGAGGFGAPDTSDDLADMTIYEKAILKPKIFEMLASLKVFEDKAKETYQYLVLDRNDIPDLTAKSMGAAGHAINSEFAALEIPFRAVPFASKEAPKVKKTVKRGKNLGKEQSVKETDCLKIYRTGKDFDSSLYAVEGWNKNSKKSGEELVYESYTEGQKLRADKWLSEVATEEIDEKDLNVIGITVE